MSDGTVLERIAAWEAEGLIDGATAARLRAAEGERPAPPPTPPSDARSALGPTPTVSEVLGYIGGAFLLAAWYVLVGQTADYADASRAWTVSFGVAALATAGLGFVLRSRGERGSRAAGVLFAVAVANAYGAGYNAGEGVIWSDYSGQLLGAGLVALAAGVIVRIRHPALLTQVALLGPVLGLALGTGAYMKAWVLPVDAGEGVGGMALDLAMWLGAAVVIGIIGLRESRTGGEAAARRAGLSRFAAGLTTVIATASILTRSGPIGSLDEYGYSDYGRLLEPGVAEAAIALVSVALLWLAFRRGAAAYLYPAAIGIVVALTDLNGSYIADRVGTGVALLIEGILILGAGLVANRVRQRLAVG